MSSSNDSNKDDDKHNNWTDWGKTDDEIAKEKIDEDIKENGPDPWHKTFNSNTDFNWLETKPECIGEIEEQG